MTVDTLAFHRMITACGATRKLVAENPVQSDYSGEHEAAVAWPLVTAAYNGIEQALKMLLQASAAPTPTLEELRVQYGHDLEKLYGALDPDDQTHIELHFGEHWSLYEYKRLNLGFSTAREFIAQLNDSDPQVGSIAWRYALLDMSVQIPKTNPWTMCEVWCAICCRIKKRAFPNTDDCFRLSERLDFKLGDILPTVDPYDGFTNDLNQWAIHKDRSLLAAWVELLVKANREAMHEVQAPDRLRPELAAMAATAIGQLSDDSAGPDEKHLIVRARQRDRDLAWDPQVAQFRWTPSSLPNWRR
ncbi:hypothetical protein [Candidatus Poriferisodalis sp.]|uniref:hypothetical protein n=1 Tax=Candidatus Poriferisodalis sp. TaxID=3101277 RepID=UPI003B01C587